MHNSPPSFTDSDLAIGVTDLRRFAEGWLVTGEIDQHSSRTLEARRFVAHKLLWFLRQREYDRCSVLELRQFLAYVTNGHKDPEGRWGNPGMTRPVRPRTVHTYHGHLRTFFNWIVAEGGLKQSPMERIPVPTARTDQIQPFTTDQVAALLGAARRSRHARRDEAIVTLLFDTGLRASELCALRRQDVDFQARRCVVMGKGRKQRLVPFGKAAAKVIWTYLREEPHDDDDPLFVSERGEPLTRSGLLQLTERLGEAAGVAAVRCSPHTFRHTFAVEFLRAGGNTFSLMTLLGHTSLHMTNRYVALAQADIESQHRQFSPADRLKRHN